MKLDKFKKWIKENKTGAWIGGIFGFITSTGIVSITLFFDTIFNFGGGLLTFGILSSAFRILTYALIGAGIQSLIKLLK